MTTDTSEKLRAWLATQKAGRCNDALEACQYLLQYWDGDEEPEDKRSAFILKAIGHARMALATSPSQIAIAKSDLAEADMFWGKERR